MHMRHNPSEELLRTSGLLCQTTFIEADVPDGRAVSCQIRYSLIRELRREFCDALPKPSVEKNDRGTMNMMRAVDEVRAAPEPPKYILVSPSQSFLNIERDSGEGSLDTMRESRWGGRAEVKDACIVVRWVFRSFVASLNTSASCQEPKERECVCERKRRMKARVVSVEDFEIPDVMLSLMRK